MKKSAIFLATTIAVALSACTSNGSSISNGTSVATALSQTWSANANLTASQISDTLVNSGVCAQTLEADSGSYGGDNLTDYNNDVFRMCLTWDSSASDASSLPCAATYYISVGDSESLFDPKRALVYEDGMSVALFYGGNYQVEIAPVNGGMMDDQELMSQCANEIAKMTSLVGGSVTKYGDYQPEYSQQEDTSTQPQVEMVPMPNFVGAADGQIRSWLQKNGYKFIFDIESTGFNSKISCMMSGRNLVLDQKPRAGTMVENSYATRAVAIVDCEW